MHTEIKISLKKHRHRGKNEFHRLFAGWGLWKVSKFSSLWKTTMRTIRVHRFARTHGEPRLKDD